MASNYTLGAVSASAQNSLSPNLSVGGITALSATNNKLVIGQSGCDIEIAGNLLLGGTACVMCKAESPVGVLLSGKSTRMLFCFDCAKQHLHGSVKELVDSLDVKDKLEEPV